MTKEEVKKVVEEVKFGTRLVTLRFSMMSGIAEFRHLEHMLDRGYVEIPNPVERHRLLTEFLSRRFSDARTYTVKITDKYYLHSLDWFSVIAGNLKSFEVAKVQKLQPKMKSV